MQHILRSSEMRACDAFAIEHLAIPPAVLMENAARAATDEILRLLPLHHITQPSILLLCGSGNNGGDGFAIARHLLFDLLLRPRLDGVPSLASLTVLWVGSTDKMSAETQANYQALTRHLWYCHEEVQAHGTSTNVVTDHVQTDHDIVRHAEAFHHADVIIDALIGVGGSEQLRGITPMLLEHANNNSNASSNHRNHNTRLKIAIDVPTGIHADTGKAHQQCFRADYTLTMAAPKAGLLLGEGQDAAGTVLTVPIGIPERVLEQHSTIHALERSDVRRLLPHRKSRTSKHDYGTVAVIAGAAGMPGAATLCANACIQAGAGLVRLYTPTQHPHPSLRAEVMVEHLPATDDGTIAEAAFGTLVEAVRKSSVIVFGPGVGRNSETQMLGSQLLAFVCEEYPTKPVVIDADGLRSVQASDVLTKHCVLTPHHGECARLTGMDDEAVRSNASEIAVAWAQRLNCTLLLKNVPTIITDGAVSYWNTTGNAGMATAGSGDVLAGMIAAILAQAPAGQSVAAAQAALPAKLIPELVALAAWLHGSAGDEYSRRYAQETLTASDLTAMLPLVLAG
jgi:NAD(P)H-hydrate epimerase